MTEELKFDQGKVRYDLIDEDATYGIARVLTHGADKYEANSWKNVEPERYLAAFHRHMRLHTKFMKSKSLLHAYDEESGLLHIDHAMCNLMFLRHFATQDKKVKRTEALLENPQL